MQVKYDLRWGESVTTRSALVEALGINLLDLNTPVSNTLMAMDYTPFEGSQELIGLVRTIALRYTGTKYEHIVITNGATGAINLALKILKKNIRNLDQVLTRPAPYFSLYPGIIANNRLEHVIEKEDERTVALVDTPSNPTGDIVFKDVSVKTIWDAAYYSPAYCNASFVPAPKHAIMCGSLSKLTGLNGIRLGWLATNDLFLGEMAKKDVAYEYCGISKPRTDLAVSIFNTLQQHGWDDFDRLSKYHLDANKEEWSKLEKYLGDASVPDNGMFHYAPIDAAAKELFTKAGIGWMTGSGLGATDDFARFNLGQSKDLLKSAVQEVLRIDKI